MLHYSTSEYLSSIYIVHVHGFTMCVPSLTLKRKSFFAHDSMSSLSLALFWVGLVCKVKIRMHAYDTRVCTL